MAIEVPGETIQERLELDVQFLQLVDPNTDPDVRYSIIYGEDPSIRR